MKDTKFWSHVSVGDDLLSCWPWMGHGNHEGYGRVRHKMRMCYAHRVAWELSRGPIPAGMLVLHSCDNPPCCNPSHLFLGTHGDNTRDKVTKGRQARGRSNGSCKLTTEQVRAIRRRYRPGMGSTLAAEFGVSRVTVTLIVNRRIWRHLSAREPVSRP